MSGVPDTERPATLQDGAASGRAFINQGSRFMVLDNASKILEPMLVLLCARLYAGGDWGFFKYYEAVLLLLMRLAVAGLDRGVIWIHARRPDDASFTRVFSRAVNFVFLFAMLLSLGAAAQWAGWLPSWTPFAQRDAGAPGFIIACYLLALPFQATTQLFYQSLINKRTLYPIILVRNVLVPATALLPAVALAFTPLKPQGLAMPYLAGSILGFLLGAWFHRRAYPGGRGMWATSAKVPGDMTRFSLPLASTDVFMSLAYRADILMLARFGGLAVVEVYAVVVMVANTLRSIRQSFDSILLSVFSVARVGRRLGSSQRRDFSYAWWIVLTLQVPFLPLALLFGHELLGLVGPQYAAGAPVLALVVTFLLVNSLGTFYSVLVTSSGRTHVVLVSQLAYLAASLGLNVVLVPRLGMTGAAIAMGCSGLVLGVVCLSHLIRTERSLIVTGEYLRAAAVAVLWFVPCIVLALAADADWPVRVVTFFVCFAGYARSAYRRWKRESAAPE